MNNLEHISDSLQTILWIKILKLFYVDPGSEMEKIRIRDQGWKKFGSSRIRNTASVLGIQTIGL